jgi:hypothetical protein
LNFVNVSTYYPRQCGLASFSKDLRDSLVKAGHKVWITAISDTVLHLLAFCHVKKMERILFAPCETLVISYQ